MDTTLSDFETMPIQYGEDAKVDWELRVVPTNGWPRFGTGFIIQTVLAVLAVIAGFYCSYNLVFQEEIIKGVNKAIIGFDLDGAVRMFIPCRAASFVRQAEDLLAAAPTVSEAAPGAAAGTAGELETPRSAALLDMENPVQQSRRRRGPVTPSADAGQLNMASWVASMDVDVDLPPNNITLPVSLPLATFTADLNSHLADLDSDVEKLFALQRQLEAAAAIAAECAQWNGTSQRELELTATVDNLQEELNRLRASSEHIVKIYGRRAELITALGPSY
jgi:hypothetical protein